MQVLSSLSGEELYPSFFFDEFLSLYRSDESSLVFSLDPNRCSVYLRGEEDLVDNVLFCDDRTEATVGPDERNDSSALFFPDIIPGVLSEQVKPILLLSRWNREQHRCVPRVSPSDIESYVACPYRWFIERRINPQAIDFERGPLEQGVFVHEVFAEFYQTINVSHTTARVTEENYSWARNVFVDIFNAKLKEQSEDDSAHYRLETELDMIEGKRLKERLLASLKRQAVLLPSFEPALHEQTIGVSDTVVYAGLSLVGRVDRVDIDRENNRFVVIDYKGSVAGYDAGFNPDKEGFSLPHKIQALIYAQVLRKQFAGMHCSGALYLSYRAKEDSGSIAGSFNDSVLDLDGFAKDKSKVVMNFESYLDQV